MTAQAGAEKEKTPSVAVTVDTTGALTGEAVSELAADGSSFAKMDRVAVVFPAISMVTF